MFTPTLTFLRVCTLGYRRHILLSGLLGVFRVAAGLSFIYLSKLLVDVSTGHASGSLWGYIWLLVGAMAVELLCFTVGNRLKELADAGVRNNLRLRLYGQLLCSCWQGREAYHSGDLLSRLTDDVRTVSDVLCRRLPGMLADGVRLVGAFVFLWWFSPALAVTLLLLMPVFLLVGKMFFRRIRRYTSHIRGLEGRLQAQMQESLQHRLLLLTMQQTGRVLGGIAGLQRALYKGIRRRANFTHYSRSAVVAGFDAGYLAAFLWGVLGLQAGTVTFGLMTAYLQLAAQIQRPMAELSQQLPALAQAQTALARLMELTRLPVEDTAKPEPAPAALAAPPALRLCGVEFTYPGKSAPTLSGFSHQFAAGSRTAILGPTGAGKSTLFRLILALLTPQKGTIELCPAGGGAAVPVSVATRSHLIYVPQGNTLLSGTIRHNLLLGNPRATTAQLNEALQTAAADFVHSLPLGLDTPCGEHGHGLSEGQAQRIAVARALLRPGSILLLDEISASLDEETETLLMQRLTKARRKHTLIIITHRAKVAEWCDEVFEFLSS